jgi:membrane-associated phospholipid phosphatase
MALPTLNAPSTPELTRPAESASRRQLIWGAAFLSMFALLAILTGLHVFDPFDLSIDIRFHHFALGHHEVVTATKVVTVLGGPLVALGGGLVAAVALYPRDGHRVAVFLAAASIGAYGVAYAVKLVVDRPRPTWATPVGSDIGPSFPSMHATGSAALATALIIGVVPLFAAVALRWIVALLLVLYMVATTITRLILGVHYPTDVLAGMWLGVGWVLLCAALVLRPAAAPDLDELPVRG